MEEISYFRKMCRCPECGSIFPEDDWLRPSTSEQEVCRICGWSGASIPVKVFEDSNGALVYIEQQ